MDETVNGIVTKVEALLDSPEGQRIAERLTEHFRKIVRCREEIQRQVARLGRRPEAAFYLSVGSSRSANLEVDVRIAGRSCGVIRLTRASSRYFTPRNHRDAWQDGPSRVEWKDRRVRAYLDRLADQAGSTSREVTVESSFLVELARRDRANKQNKLWNHQPVRIAGLPFQFPLPVSARGEPRLAKRSAAGHTDVLARGMGGRLRIIEVKKPRAPDVVHALDQGIAYAATIRWLLTRWPDVYYQVLGYAKPRKRIPIDVVALVHESSHEALQRTADRLGNGNGHFDLGGMFYRWDVDLKTGRKRVIVVDAPCLAHAQKASRQ